jgi:phage/plasmid-like protein (TIGR03299 family)
MQISNSDHAMFSVKETPWHKLGNTLDEYVNSDEARKAAKLDWLVHKLPSEYKNPITGEYIVDKSKFDLICGANGKRLGIVSDSYQVFQNREAFDFMDALVNTDDRTAMYETAGALGDGEIIWMMIRLNMVDTIGKDDAILPYLVLTNNHAGKGSLQAFFTPIRVVCQNTLSWAMSQAQNTVSIRHMGNLDQKVQEAQEVLGLAVKANEDFTINAERLTQIEVKSEQIAEDYIVDLFFPNREDEEEKMSTRATNIVTNVMDLYEGRGMGADMETAKGTAWGLYNAVTQYLDYETPSSQKTPLKSLKSNLVGRGANIKRNAFDQALELAYA